MKLTIEIANPNEVEQLLQIFRNLNLESIHIVVDEQVNKRTTTKKDLLATLHRPIKKHLDIDALKKAKNYKGVNRARFDKLVKEINIIEPIELLLSQLSQ
jgi:hypothetical protein